MSDIVEDRGESFAWSKECPNRYEITLHFSNGVEFDVPKYVKDIICSNAELNRQTLKDYIWGKPKELQGFFYNQTLDNLVDVRINDKTDYMDKTLQRFVDRSVGKYLDKKNKNVAKGQAKLPESEGHIRVKNDIVEHLKSLGVETYSEVVFYENALSDYYKWQREERRNKPNADVGFGNFKKGYGQQIKVDVAGWIGDSDSQIDYPIIAVEVMKSSNLRDEVINLNKIHGLFSIFTVVVDALGELVGTVNNTPVLSLEEFKKGIPKRVELVREAISAGKGENEIFEIGRRFNTGKVE